MELNWTFIGQTIEFVIFVWLCLKYVWPPIMAGIEQRQKEIGEGLEAAERGRKSLEVARNNAAEQIKATKKEVAEIMEQANKRQAKILDDARAAANEERLKIIEQAREEAEAEANRVKEKLRREMAELAVRGAEKIIRKNVDQNTTSSIISELVAGAKR
jgi:F-type H+-transporting ATPase subunit b